MTAIRRPSYPELVTVWKVVDDEGRLTLPAQPSKAVEQAFLWALSDLTIRAGGGAHDPSDLCLLRSLFTDSLIEWAAARIAGDFPPDLWADYQDALKGRRLAEAELDVTAQRLAGAESVITAQVAEAERSQAFYQDLGARRETAWRAEYDRAVQQAQVFSAEALSLSQAYAETASDLTAAQAEIVRLKARLWDMSEAAAAAQANQ